MPVAAAALARGVAEPQRADFSRARAGPSFCRPAACCRAPIGAPQPQLILFLLLSDMLELHACSIAAKPCEPRLHERLLSSADISLGCAPCLLRSAIAFSARRALAAGIRRSTCSAAEATYVQRCDDQPAADPPGVLPRLPGGPGSC